RFSRDWSSDVCSSDLPDVARGIAVVEVRVLLGERLDGGVILAAFGVHPAVYHLGHPAKVARASIGPDLERHGPTLSIDPNRRRRIRLVGEPAQDGPRWKARIRRPIIAASLAFSVMAVDYELRGDVAVITLNRPERFNAVTQEVCDGLVEALRRAGRDARAAVLTGAGKACCSGADLSDLMGDYDRGGPDLHRVIGERFNPMVEALLGAPVPTLAAVNGAAAGAGMGLA